MESGREGGEWEGRGGVLKWKGSVEGGDSLEETYRRLCQHLEPDHDKHKLIFPPIFSSSLPPAILRVRLMPRKTVSRLPHSLARVSSLLGTTPLRR